MHAKDTSSFSYIYCTLRAQSATINYLENTVQQLTQELAELKQRDHSESSMTSPSAQQNIYPDVRPHKKEASLTESNQKFNIVVRGMPDLMFLWPPMA